MKSLIRLAEGNLHRPEAPPELVEGPVKELTTYPFDAAASEYDATFTQTRLGRWLREAVWDHLASAFQQSVHQMAPDKPGRARDQR